MVVRIIFFIYGVVAYMIFVGVNLYGIGFVGNLVVLKTIDAGVEESLGKALLINILLISLFAIQHSVMARNDFKKWWTKLIPQSIERSTYVFISAFLMMMVMWHWKPLLGIIWDVSNPFGYFFLELFFWIGWIIVILSTFMIDHFDFFGLRQVYLNLRKTEYKPLEFRITALYKYVRHPMMFGLILAFWSTPRMTVGHITFAITMTAYILIGVKLEERDLVRSFGEEYKAYQRRVPMLVPLLKK